jgi:hypothetical protein
MRARASGGAGADNGYLREAHLLPAIDRLSRSGAWRQEAGGVAGA